MVTGLAFLGLALAILVGLALVWSNARGRELAVIDRRVGMLGASGVPDTAIAKPRAVPSIYIPERLAPLFAQAQIEVTSVMIRNIAIGVLLIGTVLLFAAGPLVTLLALVGAALAGNAWLQGRARKRVEALAEAMPLYLDTVRQLQAVGNSLGQALERALVDAPDQLKSYFEPVTRRLAMGAPVGEVMQQMADRLRIPEVSMLSAAIRTNLRFGGSISGVFNNLAHILRERTRLRRELLAATSEAKVSSRVLIAMPLIAMAFLVMMNPAYIEFFIEDERGKTLSIVAIVLEVSGVLVIRRLLRLDF